MNKSIQMGLWDVCSSRHGGNEQSQEANRRIEESGAKARMREEILYMIGESKWGLSCREAASILDTGLNNISGRFTELKRDSLIEKVSVRDNSGVYVRT